MHKLSVIVPALDEGERIATTLDALADLRALGVEVIVVDGGSSDATVQRARLRADRVLSAPRGRASQMNAGAEKATGDVLLFLHADTRLPTAAELVVLGGLERSGLAWGRFDVTIAGGLPAIPLMEDIALCKRLKRVGRPLCLRDRVITSGRRWERHGVLRTIVLMWRLRLSYFLGADPALLARRYGYGE